MDSDKCMIVRNICFNSYFSRIKTVQGLKTYVLKNPFQSPVLSILHRFMSVKIIYLNAFSFFITLSNLLQRMIFKKLKWTFFKFKENYNIVVFFLIAFSLKFVSLHAIFTTKCYKI